MAGEYRVDTLAVPETLNLLHDLLDRVREEHPELESTDVMLFETAVIEIANNVVEHGRPPGTIRYSFVLDVDSDKLLGHLSDGGPPLEESERPMPDITQRERPRAGPGAGRPRRPRVRAGRRPQRVDDGPPAPLTARREPPPSPVSRPPAGRSGPSGQPGILLR